MYSLFSTVGIVFLVLGVILALAAVALFVQRQQFGQRGAKAQGTILDYTKIHTPGAGVQVYPIIEFTTPAGLRVEFQANQGAKSRGPVGVKVPVVYNPERPQEARLDSVMSRAFMPLVLLLIGVGFCALGAIIPAIIWFISQVINS